MPGHKRKYNVRFPPSRIKKIMQKDAEVGRIATAVPVIISRALEMFLESLLTKTCLITQSKLMHASIAAPSPSEAVHRVRETLPFSQRPGGGSHVCCTDTTADETATKQTELQMRHLQSRQGCRADTTAEQTHLQMRQLQGT
uniref:Transcription factor CBF/NF-Y/archaeal histone domain-containing protein n=1 Tax=Oryzias sinensis TaxID=183150 RepID=A0A8C7X491_9TELE